MCRWLFPATRKEFSTMASLELRPAGYRIIFRVNGRRYGRSLNTKCEQTAKLALAQLELKLERFKRGDIRVKSDEDLGSVLLSAETQPAEAMRSQHHVERQNPPNCPPSMSLGKLLRDYLAGIRLGSIETNTRKMVETHVRHLERIIGAQMPVGEITRECLQRYIDTRGSEPGRRGKTISPTTIRKEITTLSAVWKWAVAENHVIGRRKNSMALVKSNVACCPNRVISFL